MGERLGGVATVLSGEAGREVDSVRGRVIEECVRLTGMAALHKKKDRNDIRLERNPVKERNR